MFNYNLPAVSFVLLHYVKLPYWRFSCGTFVVLVFISSTFMHFWWKFMGGFCFFIVVWVVWPCCPFWVCPFYLLWDMLCISKVHVSWCACSCSLSASFVVFASADCRSYLSWVGGWALTDAFFFADCRPVFIGLVFGHYWLMPSFWVLCFWFASSVFFFLAYFLQISCLACDLLSAMVLYQSKMIINYPFYRSCHLYLCYINLTSNHRREMTRCHRKLIENVKLSITCMMKCFESVPINVGEFLSD